MAVVAAGCGYKQEPTGALKPTFPVTVQDAAGRSIEVEKAPQKVVVLDPAGAKLLHAIGVKTDAARPGCAGLADTGTAPGPGRAAT